jgi:hypothetical protein
MFKTHLRTHAQIAGIPLGSAQKNHASVNNIRGPIQVECNWWGGRGRFGQAIGISLLLTDQAVTPENQIALANLQETYGLRFPQDLMELNAQRTTRRVKTVIFCATPFNPLVENPEAQYNDSIRWVIDRLPFILNHLQG